MPYFPFCSFISCSMGQTTPCILEITCLALLLMPLSIPGYRLNIIGISKLKPPQSHGLVHFSLSYRYGERNARKIKLQNLIDHLLSEAGSKGWEVRRQRDWKTVDCSCTHTHTFKRERTYEIYGFGSVYLIYVFHIHPFSADFII